MLIFGSILRPLTTALLVLGLGASQAMALSSPSLNEWPETEAGTTMAAADCYSFGQQIASQHGGTLARASSSSRGGRTVCIIVVLVPGKDGQRPRRAEFVVPAA